jgi:microcystin-dependent protein
MSVPNSFSSGTTISSAAVNANNTDIASELTNSLPRDGQASMTGQLKAASGTVGAPGLSFGSDTDTGFYRKSANTVGVVAGGSEVGTIDTNGFNSTLGVLVPIPAGVLLPYGATTAPSGWVRANGRTIGSASSAATERSNADTETLFTFLWTNYGDSVCAVSTGRGASAAADFAANKTITLPDLRGRSFFGLDDMGNSAASRLGTVITSQTTNGASGGTETHTLTEAQLPAHTHAAGTLATNTTGAHTHEVSGGIYGGSSTANFGAGGNNGPVNASIVAISSGGDHSHTISGSTGSIGSGTAHSNMPPAFIGTWIMKL